MVSPYLQAPAEVLWVLLAPYVASATATLPRGRGPPMDFGRVWPGDGRRLLGPSKTWAGFVCGTGVAFPVALLQAWLILIAPPSLAIVPQFGPTVVGAIPVALLLSAGAMTGDALGSFLKRRWNLPSGQRAPILDQLPMVALPVLVGLVAFPATFRSALWSLQGLFWLLVFTLALHTAFNWVGYKVGLKRVPW